MGGSGSTRQWALAQVALNTARRARTVLAVLWWLFAAVIAADCALLAGMAWRLSGGDQHAAIAAGLGVASAAFIGRSMQYIAGLRRAARAMVEKRRVDATEAAQRCRRDDLARRRKGGQ